MIAPQTDLHHDLPEEDRVLAANLAAACRRAVRCLIFHRMPRRKF